LGLREDLGLSCLSIPIDLQRKACTEYYRKDKMGKFRITSIGEILYDVYPEYKKLGGAPFNFIYHVWKLNGNASFISRVGDGKNGKEMLKQLKAMKFDCKYIGVDTIHPTGKVNIRLLEDKTPQFTISQESAWDYIELTDKIEKLVKQKTDILYFGTLSQRNFTTRNTIEHLLNEKIKYFCDLNLRHHFFNENIIATSLQKSNVIKINEAELEIVMESVYGRTYGTRDSVKKLIKDFDIDLLCVTMGENGAYLFSKTGSNKYKARVKNLVDTVGAGDAYAAILCLGYLNEWSIGKINHIASNFAADICTVDGAIPENDSIYKKYINEFKDG